MITAALVCAAGVVAVGVGVSRHCERRATRPTPTQVATGIDRGDRYYLKYVGQEPRVGHGDRYTAVFGLGNSQPVRGDEEHW